METISIYSNFLVLLCLKLARRLQILKNAGKWGASGEDNTRELCNCVMSWKLKTYLVFWSSLESHQCSTTGFWKGWHRLLDVRTLVTVTASPWWSVWRSLWAMLLWIHIWKQGTLTKKNVAANKLFVLECLIVVPWVSAWGSHTL